MNQRVTRMPMRGARINIKYAFAVLTQKMGFIFSHEIIYFF